MVPAQTFCWMSRSGDVPWLVSITGRVCGTAIGTEPRPTVRRTSKCSITSRTAPAKPFVSLASRLALGIFALSTLVSLLVAFELARRERQHYIESKSAAF